MAQPQKKLSALQLTIRGIVLEVPPIRVEATLRNNRLVAARIALGFTTTTQAARFFGMKRTVYERYETFKASAWDLRTLEPTPVAIRISTKLGVSMEDLWPEETRELNKFLRRNGNRAQLSVVLPKRDPSQDPREFRLSQTELRLKLADILPTLTERDRAVIELYYGLSQETPQSGSTVARLLDLSESTVSRISARVLRKVCVEPEPKMKPVRAKREPKKAVSYLQLLKQRNEQ